MNASKPFFSIVIPLYNREFLFYETIASIAEQTCKDYEVIIVNDGSTDNSAEVAESYLRKFSLNGSVLTIENSGHGVARDYGIQNSNGQFIAPIDSDDLWLPDYLKNVRNAINSCSAAAKVINFSDFFQFFESDQPDLLKSKTLVKLHQLSKVKLNDNCYQINENLFEYHDS